MQAQVDQKRALPRANFLVISRAESLVEIIIYSATKEYYGGGVMPFPDEIKDIIIRKISDVCLRGRLYIEENMKGTADKAYDIGIAGASINDLGMVEYGLFGNFNLPRPQGYTRVHEYGYMTANYIEDVFRMALRSKSLKVLEWALKASLIENWRVTDGDVESSAFMWLKSAIGKTELRDFLDYDIYEIFRDKGRALDIEDLFTNFPKGATREAYSNFIMRLEGDTGHKYPIVSFYTDVIAQGFTDDLFDNKISSSIAVSGGNKQVSTHIVRGLFISSLKYNRTHIAKYLMGIYGQTGIQDDHWSLKRIIDDTIELFFELKDRELKKLTEDFLKSVNFAFLGSYRDDWLSVPDIEGLQKLRELTGSYCSGKNVVIREKGIILDQEFIDSMLLEPDLADQFHLNREIEFVDIDPRVKDFNTFVSLYRGDSSFSFAFTREFSKKIIDNKIESLYEFLVSLGTESNLSYNDLSLDFVMNQDLELTKNTIDNYSRMYECDNPEVLYYFLEKERHKIAGYEDEDQSLFASVYSIIAKNVGIEELDEDFISIIQSKETLRQPIFGSYVLYDLILNGDFVSPGEGILFANIMDLPVMDLKTLIEKYNSKFERFAVVALPHRGEVPLDNIIKSQMIQFCFSDRPITEITPPDHNLYASLESH